MAETKFKLTEEIIATGRKSMSKLVDTLIQVDMDDLETYEFPQDQPFGLEVIYKEALFYLIIRFSPTNKNFICFSPGAFRRDRVSSDGEIIDPPHFSRWSWFRFFDETVITSADPTIFMNDEVKVGWMIGNREQWYLETLSQIIVKLAKNQNVINDNILFFGSSGGGFVSICLATLIRNSKVLVNNSQFSLKNYHQDLVSIPVEMAVPTFDGLTKEEVMEKIKYRMDIIELFKKENYAPHITYYANVQSRNDIVNHSLPLIEDIYHIEPFDGLTIIYYNEVKKKISPHQPLPSRLTIELIQYFAKNNLYNPKPATSKRLIKNEKYAKKLERQIEKLNKENENLKNKNAKMNNKNTELNNKIREMENTISWKITRPLRKLMNFIKNR